MSSEVVCPAIDEFGQPGSGRGHGGGRGERGGGRGARGRGRGGGRGRGARSSVANPVTKLWKVQDNSMDGSRLQLEGDFVSSLIGEPARKYFSAVCEKIEQRLDESEQTQRKNFVVMIIQPALQLCMQFLNDHIKVKRLDTRLGKLQCRVPCPCC